MAVKEKSKIDKKSVIKYAGSFIAWVIGSGFATGQEILQFFTSYGFWSYAAIFLNLLAFLYFSKTIYLAGYKNRKDERFNHFKYFLGDKLGAAYTWLIHLVLLSIMPVLISGAGATLHEHYGIKHYIGCALMAALVLTAYLAGFERLLKIVSASSSVIVLFLILVSLVSSIGNLSLFSKVTDYEYLLQEMQTTPHWSLSGILYISLVFLTGSSYFTQIGKTGNKSRELKYGAIAGSVFVILTITTLSTAMLLQGDQITSTAIPILFLAGEISSSLGAIFSIILVLGIFSSCSAMLWTVCNRFDKGGKSGNKLFAIAVALIVYIISLLPFAKLIATLYPLVGYIGLLFIFGMLLKGIKEKMGR